MKFGPVPLALAEGAILAHSEAVAGGRLRKGLVLGPQDLALLAAAGRTEVTVARPGPGDITEDEAAARLGAALVPEAAAQRLSPGAAVTGRVNLFARGPGILDLDPEAVLTLNLADPMITLATLPRFARVGAGTMIGTVKIIAYAVPGDALARAEAAAALAGIRVRAALWPEATLIETVIPGVSPDKGEAAVRARLEALGVRLAYSESVPHETAPLAAAIARAKGMVLILTASATSDPEDTAPAAARLAGGSVTRFGMPVDPGNLLFLGEISGRPLIGLPGCARSPAPNGADLVLDRLACGVPVTGRDIAAMGVGGLLKETRARGRPRAL